MAKEIEQLIAGFEQSGLGREYCEQQKITLTSFDYYRQRRLPSRR